MSSFIISVLLAALALLAIALRKTYAIVPPKELKRQARSGDHLAKILYRSVAYGMSLDLLLWIIIVLSAAASFVVLMQVVPTFLAFVFIVLILGYGFAWMPHGDVTQIGVRVVVAATPVVAWLLAHLQPVIGRLASFIARHRPVTVHTGLYEREDLLELLERQKGQPDSRFSADELSLLSHALTYSQKVVSDVMVPRRGVKLVKASDDVGPIIMDELHDSGHSRFPVYEGDDEDHIVGTLFLRDLVNARKSGHIKNLMDSKVYYVHEDYTLEQALHAFLKTKRHLFIVINNFEEFVGIITIEDILEQVIGHKIIDEFDQYEDMRAVAQHQAEKEHAKHKKVAETVAETAEPSKPATNK